jgi:hypothetical protein
MRWAPIASRSASGGANIDLVTAVGHAAVIASGEWVTFLGVDQCDCGFTRELVTPDSDSNRRPIMPIIDIHASKGSVSKVVMRTALAFLAAATTAPSAALAGETESKAMLKAMTDYMAAQKELSFRYDASIEAVTKDGEKLQLANSGRVALARPDRIAATRSGGFADIETIFDGKTMTILGKTKNVYLSCLSPVRWIT